MRAAQVVPAFRSAIVLHLVEVNPKLRERQQQVLGTIDVPAMWHESFDDVPDGPAIILANEFFDALPVNQAIKQFNGWYERVVEIDAKDNLVFGIANDVIPLFDQLVPKAARDAPIGAVYEWRTDNVALGIGTRVTREPGAALIIDYGHLEFGVGDTLQAMAGHAFVDPLARPGEADLTTHVDFATLAATAQTRGAKWLGTVPQGEWLRALGIETRAESLSTFAPHYRDEIHSAKDRLIGEGQMGLPFKVMGLAHPGWPDAVGF